MPRLHLFEIHEQPWCPAPVRDGATDCLRVIADVGRQFSGAAPHLRAALEATGATQIVDLCAGGGGPWRSLLRTLNAPSPDEQRAAVPYSVLLTDLFPNWSDAAPAPQIRYARQPVDATAVPDELEGFRTLFTALHHFRPPTARAILQDAVNKGQGIAVFEQTRRSPLALLTMLALPVLAPLAVLLTRPLRPAVLFWTFVVPAVPLVLLCDGLVSCLRTYSVAEMEALVAGLDAPNYGWQIGRVRAPLSPIGVTFLIGVPRGEETQHKEMRA